VKGFKMEQTILEKIKSYDTIIIHRHNRPDFDAYGSQLGLASLLKLNFPKKNVYVVGDDSSYPYPHQMDIISDETYNGALAFILDTCEMKLVSDDRYKLAKELIVIDHHLNETNLNPTIIYKNEKWISCSEIIADLAIKWGFEFNKESASHMLAGIIGDSGRYNYINKDNGEHTFYISSVLMRYGVDVKEIYDFLYIEPLAKRQARLLFSDFKLSENNVAYRFNDQALIEKSGLDFFSVSRGMVNGMAGIKEVPIWANFTENEAGEVVAELRSRNISIVDIAKKYGGGGHANACGATLKSFDEAMLMINDLNERAKQ